MILTVPVTVTDPQTGEKATASASAVIREPGQWGCTWIGAPGVTAAQVESALTGIETTTGRAITTRKVYLGPSDGTGSTKYFPLTIAGAGNQAAYLQACKDRGDRACICYMPFVDANGNGTPADRAALQSSLMALTALGLNVAGVPYQEGQDHLSQARFLGMWAYYRPVFLAAGVPMVYDCAGHTGAAQWAAYEPPAGQKPEIYAVDWYFTSFARGILLDPLIAMANAAGKPVAVFEAGISVGSEIPPDLATINAAFAHLTSRVRNQQDAGLPFDSVMWYFQPLKNGANDPSPYVPQIQELADTLTLAA